MPAAFDCARGCTPVPDALTRALPVFCCQVYACGGVYQFMSQLLPIPNYTAWGQEHKSVNN